MAGTAGSLTFDWGLGSYERTAAQLAPASAVVVERAAPKVSERVLDLGCGTGNAALLAAARGATVTGVDPAPRLLDVARARAAEQSLDIKFSLGEAGAIPMEGGSVDVVLSVFGVIFAPDPLAAAGEMARVSTRHSRIVLTAWRPEGPISRMARMARETPMMALGAPPMPPPFAWHDQSALTELLAPHGFDLEIEEHRHVFRAASIAGTDLERAAPRPRSGRGTIARGGRPGTLALASDADELRFVAIIAVIARISPRAPPPPPRQRRLRFAATYCVSGVVSSV